ncbi:MAG TPA: GFA family protein [Hyphomonadaceae bacterium]|jgi:hypothetical protein|nr:GFA family protein [Hyphomonadaceae bacterium]
MKKTYSGSCHCGRVRYEADIDFDAAKTGRCNCSFCAKVRSWGITLKPEEFRLLSDPSETSDYQFGTMSGHHRFCTACGMHAYGDGYVEQIGGAFVSVQISCLDGVSPEELAALPIHYSDGLNDNWWNQPKVTSYL